MIAQSQKNDPWANVVEFDNQSHEHAASPDPYASSVDFSTQAPSPQDQGVDRTARQFYAKDAQSPIEISTTKHVVDDPWAKQHGVMLGHMVANGASEDQIIGFIRGTGGDPASLGIGPGARGDVRPLQERETPDFKEWHRRYPNEPYPFATQYDAPLNHNASGVFGFRRDEQVAAENSAGPVAAATVAAGDAATMGGLSLATGAEGTKKMQLMSDAHPGATIAGTVMGSALPAAGFEAAGAGIGSKIPGVLGKVVASPITANAVYGGVSQGLQTGDPLAALMGAGTSALGGTLGRGIGTPSAGQSATLDKLGTLTTVGQRQGGLIGGIEKAWEKLPISGALVRGARSRARDQFQRGLINDALSEIDGNGGAQGALPKDMPLGTQPHVFVKEQFNKAYDDARAGMMVASDPEFVAGTTKLAADLQDGGLDVTALARFNKLVNNKATRRFDANGNMSGDDYKSAVSDLRKASASIRKSPSGDGELADALDEYTSLLDQAARRASPPEAVAKLDAADRGYSKLVRIRMASNSPKSGGKFSPDDYANAVQTAATGQKTKSNAYLEGDALGQANADAGLSLGDKPTLHSPLGELVALGGGGYVSHLPVVGAGPALASIPYLFAARSNPLLQAGGRAVAAFGAPVGASVAHVATKSIRSKKGQNR